MPHPKLSVFRLGLGCIAVLLLAACALATARPPEPTLDPSLTDRSWLSGAPCAAPCWYGLLPGQSTAEEAAEKIKRLSFVDPASLETRVYSYWVDPAAPNQLEEHLSFNCATPAGVPCGLLSFRAGVLYQVALYPNSPVTLAEAAESLGPPDGFVVTRTTPEAKGCLLSVFWQARQTYLQYNEGWSGAPFKEDLCEKVGKAGNKIPPDLPVQSVYLVDLRLMDQLTAQSGYTPWNGFAEKQ